MPWRYNFSARVFRRVYVFFILFNQTPSSHQPAKAVVSLRMWAVPVAVAVVLVVVTFHIIPMPRFGTRHRLRGKHVLITGGSKGLGLSLAKEFVRKGCHVTVVARAQADLLAALQSLDELATSMSLAVKVQALSADTASAEELHRAFETAEKVAGPVDILFCNAGLSKPGLFIEQPIEDFERTMQVNYVGTLRTIKCALPGMLQRRSGHIVITTSVLSVLGFAGYSSYAPSKWALRGLADCLHNELQGTGIKISVAYPPDTDTPGYATENTTKPGLCHAVNKSLGSALFQPDQVAAKMVGQLEGGAYHLTTPDFGSNILISSMTGLTPKSIPLGIGIFIAPIVQLAAAVAGAVANKTAKKYNQSHGYPDGSTR